MGVDMTDRSNSRFVRQNLYALKRQYGVDVTVHKILDTETDYQTGDKTVTKETHDVRRAIMLPVEEARKVEQGIAHLSANKWFVSQGGFDLDRATFIFDARDLPTGFEFTLNDFVVVEGAYYCVTEVDEYEYDSGWIIKTHLAKGADLEETP
jgi:hypothetical protein